MGHFDPPAELRVFLWAVLAVSLLVTVLSIRKARAAKPPEKIYGAIFAFLLTLLVLLPFLLRLPAVFQALSFVVLLLLAIDKARRFGREGIKK